MSARFLALLTAALFAGGCAKHAEQPAGAETGAAAAPPVPVDSMVIGGGPGEEVPPFPTTPVPAEPGAIGGGPGAMPPPVAAAPAPAEPGAIGGGPPSPAHPSPAPAPATADSDYSTVKIFYGTNRTGTPGARPDRMYGSRPGPLDLGVLRVTVPVKGRKAGDIPRPAWYRLQFHEDVRKHVVLGSVTPLSPEQWVSDFRASVEATTDSAALVFVHGFNVSFVEAAWRAGQLAYDLAFDGTTAMYSWPSKDDPEAYFVDRTTADQSAGRLADFLTLITERTGARRVHLVAHSLGNQVLAQALDEMARRELGGMAMGAVGGSRQGAAPPSSRPMPWFNHVVLAAPDIDATLFSETIFPRIRGTAQDWTLYASTQDLALGVSSRIAGYTRLGKIRGTPTIIDGVTTIDASVVKGDLIGHSYFADVLPLIQDLHDLIALNAEPSRRNALRPSGPFWVLRWGE